MSNNYGYIYLISFYIGKTTRDISKRFYEHLHSFKSVREYMLVNGINNDNVHIDIIDRLNMDEIVYNDKFNIVSKNYRLDLLERFHIDYFEKSRYSLINIQKCSFNITDYDMFILKKGYTKYV